MKKKYLSVSRQQDRLSGIIIEKKKGGYFAGEPIDLSSREALGSTCRSIDEIHINDSFLSATYVWNNFPKVPSKHLSNLLYQDALEKFESQADPNIAFKIEAEAPAGDGNQQAISYIAVEDAKILEIWNLFKDHTKKIKSITSLPASLASTVAASESPNATYIVTWIGDKESVIVIAALNGSVKMARNFPFGIKEADLDSPETLQAFSQRIDKELNRTVNFFKQNFRESEPKNVYIFGNPDIERIFRTNPLTVPGADYFFQLTSSLINNYTPDREAELFHVFSSLFSDKHFNFLPKSISARKKDKKIYYPVYAVIFTTCVVLAIWSFQLQGQIDQEKTKVTEKYNVALNLQKNVEELENKVNRLKPLRGWKTFYDQTFKNKVAWDKILSDLGRQTPSNIVLDSLLMVPDAQNNWKGNVSGQIQAPSWEIGLEELRVFGANIDTSPYFAVNSVNYMPQTLDAKTKFFTFQMVLGLK
ncbi:hypothetical protein [Desulfobacula phenolica]|uniref:Fimbrial assembly protein (PilN) n=1 Tax=Desulfobacula phenolica TaxID=90732 RepID=A0A1H2J0I9_9BACT|nr:hypothetical protein [Desulfobacula phenolica]SDU49923.1 hypothetical protein SAMN04487931_11064 [Desulfobacula phenolica]